MSGKGSVGEMRIKEIIFAGDALEVLLSSSTGHEVKVKSDVSILPQLNVGSDVELFVDATQIGQVN